MEYVIWGAGVRGRRLNRILGVRNYCFIDSDPLKIGNHIDGKNIVSYQEYLYSWKNKKAIIVAIFNDAEKEKVMKRLSEDGCSMVFDYCLEPGELLFPACWDDSIPYEEILLENGISDVNQNIVLQGNSLFTYMLYDYMKCHGYQKIFIDTDNLKMKECVQQSDNTISFIDSCYSSSAEKWCTDKKYSINNKSMSLGRKLYSFSHLNRYNNKSLERFHNTASVDRCFIVLNGPSLRLEDLEMLKRNGEKCFAVNRIYLVFDNVEWRPDYYVADDGDILYENAEEIMDSIYCTAFLGDTTGINGSFCRMYCEQIKQRDNMNVYHFIGDGYGEEGPDFSSDITRGVFYGGTVAYSCIQLAYYLGYKKIFLVGADCGADNRGRTHFSNNYVNNAGKGNADYLKALQAYKKAKEFSMKKGFSIYNATRGGCLEVFERVSIDDVI